jgi:hypothetical protein
VLRSENRDIEHDFCKGLFTAFEVKVESEMIRFCALVWVAIVAGCAAPATPIYQSGLYRERFTRVNFRPEAMELGSSQLLVLPSTIPAGSRSQLTMYSATEVHVKIKGIQYVMRPVGTPSFPVADAGVSAFLNKYFVNEKEDLNLATMGPPELTEMVLHGKHLIRMTKEQVYTAVGPPMRVGNGTPSLDLTYDQILASNQWVYPYQMIGLAPTLVKLTFRDGRLVRQEP